MSGAAADVPMPRLSDSMEEGTVVRWLKRVGDEVASGEPLVEIATDKADVVYEADVAGTLLEQLVAEGASVAVGDPIARVGDGATAGRAPGEGSGASRQLRCSPLARRLADELGVDLATVRGSGPNGRIVKADVTAAAAERAAAEEAVPAVPAVPAEPTPAPGDADPVEADGARRAAKGEVRLVEPTPLQRTVARRMAQSKATVPHFHVTVAIDMTRCRQARERLREGGGRVPSFNDMVVKACALALRGHPRANGAWTDAGFELYSRINVGIAVAADGALVVPTIFDADRKGLSEIAAESVALAERVRAKTIAPAELEGGTFTVSNLGMFGVEEFAPVVNPPQAAILAVGAITEQPVGRDGEIVLAPVMRATLACDHRILYGADGAALLADVRRLLEEPLGLAG